MRQQQNSAGWSTKLATALSLMTDIQVEIKVQAFRVIRTTGGKK